MKKLFARLENLWQLVCCFFVYFRRGKMTAGSLEGTKAILVVPAGKLGDMVATTPLLRALEKHAPHATIWVEDSVGVREQLLEATFPKLRYVALATKDSVGRFRKEHPEVEVALFCGLDFPLLARLYCSGVSTIVTPHALGGFCPQQTISYRILLPFVKTFPFCFGAFAPRERLRALEPFGVMEDDAQAILRCSEKARAHVAVLLQDRVKPLIGISLTAGNKVKDWGVENFVILAQLICAKYDVESAIIGGPSDKGRAQEFLRQFGSTVKVYDYTGQFSLDELTAFMEKLTLFVSVDTGPLYVAAAVGTPTVDILGPMDEREQPPVGPRNVVVYDKSRKEAAIHILNARVYDAKEARRQCEAITPEQVSAVVVEFLLNTIE